jgi:hypothetical protein
MDGWMMSGCGMVGWMSGCGMVGWMGGWIVGWTDGLGGCTMNRCLDGSMDRWIEWMSFGWLDRWIDGLDECSIDAWMDGWMDGQMD